MTIPRLRGEITRLINDIRLRTGGGPTEYTKGYVDALRYIEEWIEEEDEE